MPKLGLDQKFDKNFELGDLGNLYTNTSFNFLGELKLVPQKDRRGQIGSSLIVFSKLASLFRYFS